MNSPVLVWPDRAAVDQAVRSWACRAAAPRPDVVGIGYFGSYARGDWGDGSDVDVIIVVSRSSERFEGRPLEWDAAGLPVPADIVVCTVEEWASLAETRFGRTVRREAVWVRGAGSQPAAGS